ncbi:MAG: AAA family ATPase, partial [Parcubacteria group bacterium]|nr:AAA family ATPase [Parcubacteria group bacterium]
MSIKKLKYEYMYLQRLELQGFKSFAPKTGLEFLLPKDGKRGITAIVGPNGSGKSNVADAIRWALGEQSMKMIRGKKGEDVIFSGTNKKARSGFAEVSLYLNNDEKTGNNPYSEVALTRRLYRTGDSEYLLNKNKVRLSDIHLMAAKSNIGSRSYSVIGQGTIDKILTLSDDERKDFFNEATGIKQYQIKKDQSLNKLAAAKKNLEQVEIILQEIEPRLRSLRKQAKKLEEREELETELNSLEYNYYGSLWQEIKNNILTLSADLEKAEEKWKVKKEEINSIQKEFEKLEKEKPSSETFLTLQSKYQQLLEEKNLLKEKEWELRNLVAAEETKGGEKTISISMRKISEELDKINERQKRLILN